MAKTRLLLEHCCYHIYVRGNRKKRIFKKASDFEFYLEQLRRYKKRYPFLLYGYCLMPNHIHLLGEIIIPDNLPKLMQCLQRSYTAYFNKTYKIVGHLWQGRFKAKIINKDRYLINCAAYIEENPVRANLVRAPIDYRFCSYAERNLGKSNTIKVVDKFIY